MNLCQHDKCPKCGTAIVADIAINCRYIPGHGEHPDKLGWGCKRCGYKWETPCADAKEKT